MVSKSVGALAPVEHDAAQPEGVLLLGEHHPAVGVERCSMAMRTLPVCGIGSGQRSKYSPDARPVAVGRAAEAPGRPAPR